MTEHKIKFADTYEIEQFEDTARAFFKDVLDMDYDEIFISDESMLKSLSMAFDAGWEQEVAQKIEARYGVRIDRLNIYLITLFNEIEKHAKGTLQ